MTRMTAAYAADPIADEPRVVRAGGFRPVVAGELAGQRRRIRWWARAVRHGRQRDLGTARAGIDRPHSQTHPRRSACRSTRSRARCRTWRRTRRSAGMRVMRRRSTRPSTRWYGASAHFLVRLVADRRQGEGERRVSRRSQPRSGVTGPRVLATTKADRDSLTFLALALDAGGQAHWGRQQRSGDSTLPRRA